MSTDAGARRVSDDDARWAKAARPRTPEERERLRAQAAEDRRRYLDAGSPLTCDHCGATVLVRKNSFHHTSVQWPEAATRRCPFLENVEMGSPRRGCPELAETIRRAVVESILEVGD